VRRRDADVGPPTPALLESYEEPDWTRPGDTAADAFTRWRAARKTWGDAHPGSPLADAVCRIRFERTTRHRLAGIAEGAAD